MDPVPLTIPLWADLLAVSIGSLQGAMFAAGFRDRRLDLLGIAIIGTATGLGGGLLRDVFLNVTPAALASNWLMIFTRLDVVITVLDALTIGLFCAIGTSKALAAGVPEVPAVFIGVVSAVGGSFVRDLLLNLPIAMMHVGSLYAVAAAVGAIIVVTLAAFGVPMGVAAIVCVAVTATTRVLAVRFGWSLPEQRALSRLRFTVLRRPRPRR
jgi:uncharacterized membrane protein YeiH